MKTKHKLGSPSHSAKDKKPSAKNPALDQTTDALVLISVLKQQSKGAEKQISNLVVKTQTDYENAIVLLKTLKEYDKRAEEKELSLTDPITETLRIQKKLRSDISELFAPFRNNITQITEDTKQKLLVYIEANKVQAAKLESDFEAGKIKKVATLVGKTAALVTSGNRKVWSAVCINEQQTPRQYLIPDLVAIKAALKEGKQVTGWKWEQIDQITI